MDINALIAASPRAPYAASRSAPGAAGGNNFRDLVASATARQTSAPATDPREFIPDYGNAAPAGQRSMSEAEAKITAAQIAAQANVYAPLKRDPVIATVPAAEAAPPVTVSGRFLPINRAPVAQQGQTIASRAIDPKSVEALRASNKFAPGAVSTSNAAALAAARRLEKAHSTPAADAADPVAAAPMPPWFDQAMRNMDKYSAMKTSPASP